MIASLASLDIPHILDSMHMRFRTPSSSGTAAISSEDADDPLLEYEQGPSHANEAHRTSFKATYAALSIYRILSGLTWLLLLAYVLSRWSSGSVPGGSPAVDLDHPFDLDIVVARYEEPLQQVAENMNRVMSTESISGLRTRIFLYNKSQTKLNGTDKALSFPLARKVIVEDRPNVGREAETYLSHILDKDDLAPHTLFVQAQPHELWELQTRINQYFGRRTGFLSLSYPNSFCFDCSLCGDVSGWHEDKKVLEDTFSRSNPGRCQDISLTYRGQFIASAATIRKIDSQVFRDARERVLDEVEFGYTMERLWGVLLGCSRISASCPILLSGLLGNRGRLEECQCLDGDDDG